MYRRNRRLRESQDRLALMRDNKPVDELEVWAQSNMPENRMNAGDLSKHKITKVNGIDIRELDSMTETSIEQWIGNGWWSNPDWNAYEASGDPRDLFDVSKFPKQTGPNTFRIKAPERYINQWGLVPNNGYYEVEITEYNRTEADDLSDKVEDFLMNQIDKRGMTTEKLNSNFMRRFGSRINTPGVRQGVQSWNKQWPGYQISLNENKTYNRKNKETQMRLTKGQLKRIIREEYSRLKRRGLIREGRKNKRGGKSIADLERALKKPMTDYRGNSYKIDKKSYEAYMYLANDMLDRIENGGDDEYCMRERRGWVYYPGYVERDFLNGKLTKYDELNLAWSGEFNQWAKSHGVIRVIWDWFGD